MMLSVRGLTVTFDTPTGPLRAVDSVSFDLDKGGTLGIVGESGSGKSQMALALTGLLAGNGRATGQALFHGDDLLAMDAGRLNAVRGSRIAMVFQDPMASLNPYLRIRTQMVEVLRHHRGMSDAEASSCAIRALDAVRIPDAHARLAGYPHELSGGMRQRVMIAMALLCDPDLLIADEPTTALDVTVQAQILELLADVRRDFGTAVIMITHDLAIVSGLCERVMVMYAGRGVESAPTGDLFRAPAHPYTEGLLGAIPRLDAPMGTRLVTIEGSPPDPQALAVGCSFAPRCPRRVDRCDRERPAPTARGPGRDAACHVVWT